MQRNVRMMLVVLTLAVGVATASPAGPARSWRIYDNGPFVTHWGTGAGGAHESWVQFPIGLTAYGFIHKAGTIDEIADDFTVPDGWEWTVESITFYSYELYGATQPSTVNWVSFIMWDGPPDTPGTEYVFGDFYTNRLTSSVWTGCYRVGEGSSGNDDRPIMANTCVLSPPLVLSAGTYWMVWQTEGSQDYGPYSPPVTILGQPDTGNALVTEDGGLSYVPATDNHHQQGFPFYIEGTVLDTPVARTSWGAVKALFR
jgi:hypothetical protein